MIQTNGAKQAKLDARLRKVMKAADGFNKIGTASYAATRADPRNVLGVVKELAELLAGHDVYDNVDLVSITLANHTGRRRVL